MIFSQIYDAEGDSAAGRRWADSVLAEVPAEERIFGHAHPVTPAMKAAAFARLGMPDSALAATAEALRRSEKLFVGYIDPGIRLLVARVLCS